MKEKRVTLADLAKKSGYSANTISRALRDDRRLPVSTREKIHQLAADMGYIRNTAASSLRSGKSHVVAVILNNIQNLHNCDVLTDMETELRSAGYTLTIMCMHMDDLLAEKLIHHAISLSVDGILFFPNTSQKRAVASMARQSMPFVLVDRHIQGVEADGVRCDDVQGGYLAGEHLARLGHRRFLFLSSVALNSSQNERLEGFLRALRDHGIPEENVRIIAGEQAEGALASGGMPAYLFPVDYTAIVCFRDELAYTVLYEMREKGLGIPGDVSLISFDHLHASDPIRPAVTSIYTEQSIGRLAVRMLLDRIENPGLTPRSCVLPVRIFDQGTTAAPKATEANEPGNTGEPSVSPQAKHSL